MLPEQSLLLPHRLLSRYCRHMYLAVCRCSRLELNEHMSWSGAAVEVEGERCRRVGARNQPTSTSAIDRVTTRFLGYPVQRHIR